MDKVKAIKVLKPLVDSYVDYANITMKEEDDDIVDALEMAIEALKALDVPDMNVGDMISRQMAIDSLHGYFDGMLETDTWSPCDVYGLIELLPSAQPEQVCVANVTLTDEQVKEVVEKAKNAVISVIELEPHWIPCSERLPNHDEYIKNNGLFIVSDGNRSYSEWYDIYDKRKFGEPTMSGFRIDYAVTAWMPLPAS